MYVTQQKLKSLCQKRGLGLHELLSKAGVSKTAFYSLVRKREVLPKSITAIARTLGVPSSAFLEEKDAEEQKMLALMTMTDTIMKENPRADRDNVWHTLLLLQEKPIERLRRSLLRGQKFDFYRRGSRVS